MMMMRMVLIDVRLDAFTGYHYNHSVLHIIITTPVVIHRRCRITSFWTVRVHIGVDAINIIIIIIMNRCTLLFRSLPHGYLALECRMNDVCVRL